MRRAEPPAFFSPPTRSPAPGGAMRSRAQAEGPPPAFTLDHPADDPQSAKIPGPQKTENPQDARSTPATRLIEVINKAADGPQPRFLPEQDSTAPGETRVSPPAAAPIPDEIDAAKETASAEPGPAADGPTADGPAADGPANTADVGQSRALADEAKSFPSDAAPSSMSAFAPSDVAIGAAHAPIDASKGGGPASSPSPVPPAEGPAAVVRAVSPAAATPLIMTGGSPAIPIVSPSSSLPPPVPPATTAAVAAPGKAVRSPASSLPGDVTQVPATATAAGGAAVPDAAAPAASSAAALSGQLVDALFAAQTATSGPLSMQSHSQGASSPQPLSPQPQSPGPSAPQPLSSLPSIAPTAPATSPSGPAASPAGARADGKARSPTGPAPLHELAASPSSEIKTGKPVEADSAAAEPVVSAQTEAAGDATGKPDQALSVQARPAEPLPPASPLPPSVPLPAAAVAPHPAAVGAAAVNLQPTPHADLERRPVAVDAPLGAVAIEIGVRAMAGMKRFEIRLDPPELGRVDVRLDLGEEGTVKAHLIVEKAETLALLQRDGRTLERALEQAGLKPEGVDLSLRDQTSQHGHRNGEERRDAPPTPRRASAAEQHDDIAPTRPFVRPAGLDLRI